MHYWGEWSDHLFCDVEAAANDIGNYLRRWGRISVTQTKEKYGTARVYCHFGWHQLHSITHPGYVFSQYPNWLWKFDCLIISEFIRLTRINYLIVPIHMKIYKHAYRKALTKYPHIRKEILGGADFGELLEGL